LNPRSDGVQPDTLAALPCLPRDEDGPVFAEPWQAQAFALAVKLSELKHFTWSEWAAVLSEELKADAARGEPDDGSRYYHCWLAALERLVVAKQLFDRATLLERKEAWAEAYRHTPHGMPVELKHWTSQLAADIDGERHSMSLVGNYSLRTHQSFFKISRARARSTA
jgi:nitrile hydratase accessory protein